jgi:phospholipase/carboxylesterase
MSELLDCVVVETGAEPEACVIWLHGLGADGHDFEPIVPHLRMARPTRFVFPHAPRQPVTINGGMVMRAWYDILEMSIQRHVDAEGIAVSRQHIEALLGAEKARGFVPGRIVLAGFSQGGAMTLDVGLQHAETLAGLLVLSAYLPVPDALQAAKPGRVPPIFMGHGSFDPVVPAMLGQASAQAMQGAGLQVDWRTYPAPHSTHPQEIADVGRWLNARLFGV